MQKSHHRLVLRVSGKFGRLAPTIVLLLLFLALAGCWESPEGSLKLGTPAPIIRTVTLNDVGGDLSRITTYRYPDERMYQYSLDDALSMKRPIVLAFATPAHCTVCDKQLQMLKSMMNKYEDQGVIFIHMDQYQNPGAYKAFRVKGEPWTFFIDAEGFVRFKRPGSLLYGELNYTLEHLLSAKKG